MARRSELEGRLVAILDSGVSRRSWGRRAQAASVAVALAIAAPLAMVRAQDPAIPPEAEATVRAANAQNNHEILDRAAAAYEKTARFDVARKLLENSLTIREQSGSAAYAAGLVKLGDLAAKRGQPAEADAFYAKAVSLGDRPEVAGALVYLGQRALGRFDRTTAENYFQRALTVDATGPNAGKAFLWLAAMRQSSFGGESEAELFYQKSIAADPANGQARINSAGLLRRQKRFDEAEQMENDGRSMARTTTETVVNPSGVYRVGNGVSAPSLLFKTEPEYSMEARAAKLQGTVLLYVEIDPDGTAQNFAVRRSLGLGLDEQSIEAVKRWKFKPAMKDGWPVTVAATIEDTGRLG
jgi:TonB family protein